MNQQETRRLSILVPVRDIEKLRALQQQDEGISDLMRRIIHERAITLEGAR